MIKMIFFIMVLFILLITITSYIPTVQFLYNGIIKTPYYNYKIHTKVLLYILIFTPIINTIIIIFMYLIIKIISK